MSLTRGACQIQRLGPVNNESQRWEILSADPEGQVPQVLTRRELVSSCTQFQIIDDDVQIKNILLHVKEGVGGVLTDSGFEAEEK